MPYFDNTLYSMRAHGVDRAKIPIRIFHRNHSYNSPVPIHHHDFLEIALILSGTATHTIRTPEHEEISYPVVPGDVCVIVPGQIHSFSFQPEESIEITNILFSQIIFQKTAKIDEDQMNLPEFLNQLTRSTQKRPSSMHLSDEMMTRICTLVSNIEREAMQHTVGYGTMILVYFSAILTLLFRQYREQKTDAPVLTENGLINQLLQFLNHHYQEDITLQQLADMTHFSTRQITRRFKSTVGLSVSEYILSQRLAHARDLLTTTDMKIADIALATGFSNPSYFCEQFRKVMACTPNQFRNGDFTTQEEPSQ